MDPLRVRPLWAAVDLDAVRSNIRLLNRLAGPRCGLMAIVKANAYGHGDTQVARAALEAGAGCLGVALVEEGQRLRETGITQDVYLLFEPPPSGARAALESGLICSVYSEPFARALASAAADMKRVARVHVKIDTGMHRVGVDGKESVEFASTVARLPGIRLEGVYTHFAVATAPADGFTDRQMDAFEAAADGIEKAVGRRLVRHAANSAGAMAFPRSRYDLARVGISMLGLSPSESVELAAGFRPALSLAGEVAFVKKVAAGEGVGYGLTWAPRNDTWIATLPIGYADGFSRLLSGKAHVLIGGKRRPVVGTVCMDLCMADLGDEPVKPGTRFTVIGEEGDERITAEEVARKMGTINYEVVCMIGARVPRVFKGESGKGMGG